MVGKKETTKTPKPISEESKDAKMKAVRAKKIAQIEKIAEVSIEAKVHEEAAKRIAELPPVVAPAPAPVQSTPAVAEPLAPKPKLSRKKPQNTREQLKKMSELRAEIKKLCAGTKSIEGLAAVLDTAQQVYGAFNFTDMESGEVKAEPVEEDYEECQECEPCNCPDGQECVCPECPHN